MAKESMQTSGSFIGMTSVSLAHWKQRWPWGSEPLVEPWSGWGGFWRDVRSMAESYLTLLRGRMGHASAIKM